MVGILAKVKEGKGYFDKQLLQTKQANLFFIIFKDCASHVYIYKLNSSCGFTPSRNQVMEEKNGNV
jgi:hypothetical protein